MELKEEKLIKKSELVLALSGLFIIVSAGIVYFTQDFTIWTIAKILYLVGVLLVLFDR